MSGAAETLFGEALPLAADERREFLERACAGDAPLRAEVESLLAAHDACGDFLAPPPRPAAPPSRPAGSRVGRYRVDGPIARGGMGEVFAASRADGAFEQRVALKLLRHAGGPIDDATRERLERERRVLAALEHPYIARLIDGGEAEDGTPYIVMERIDGLPIDRHCAERALPLEARLRLFLRVCEAVACAHRNLVVHCDLKPANILVREDGTPRLVDFGVAARLALPDEERADGLTPRYASPERLRGERPRTPADVYSLGRILGEIANAPDADLGAIVDRATEADPERRTESVAALAADVERLLASRPVLARRTGFLHRARLFARRNRAAVAAGAAALVAAAAGGVAATEGYRRAIESERAAVAGRESAHRVTRFFEELLADASPYRRGREASVIELLDGAAARLASKPEVAPESESALALAIGRAYANLWSWRESVPHLRRAVALLSERREAASDETLAEALSLLGRALTFVRDAGAAGEAVATQERALEIRRRLFGKDHVLVAESLTNLAYAHWGGTHEPRFDTAEPLYRAALATYERSGAEPDANRARALLSFAVMLAAARRGSEVEPLARAALDVYERLGETEGGPYRVQTELLYADCLERKGRLAEAAALFERGLAATPAFRLETRRVLEARLARVAARSGDDAAAESRAREALSLDCEIAAKNGGPGAREEFLRLARCARDGGRRQDGDAAQLAFIAGALSASGSDRALSATEALVTMAAALERRGEASSAATIFASCAAAREAFLGPSHPATAAARSAHERCLAAASRENGS